MEGGEVCCELLLLMYKFCSINHSRKEKRKHTNNETLLLKSSLVIKSPSWPLGAAA